MAWLWSHTAEGISSAYRNVRKLDREDLTVIFAEWKAYDIEQDPDNEICPYSESREYDNALLLAGTLTSDILADYIWERMEEYATCDNGGFNAWCCPYGCHTVSFGD